ncbi:TPA: hypothetical protein PPJ15_003465 [Escherichia coli]|nr:hypothetical protein [Escherichia coli]HDJ0750617.1 hypothetical protein [Escherichia coli]
MAYSEEQRPEAQLGNQNRNSLNIQQPGETDSYEAFFSDPNRWKDNSTSFSLGDVLPTMGKGFAQSVRGTGEMARGLGDAMIQSPVKTGARILNEFSRMGLPGVATVQDIFAGGSRGADEVIDTLPDGKNAVTDTVGKGLKATGKAVSDGAKASDEWLTDNMSPGAVRALNTPMSEGYDDPAVWLTKGMNFVGAVAADVFAGGVAKKVGDVTLRKMLTAGLEKKYIAAGMQPERATALAAEAVDKKMPDLFRAGLITHSTVSAQGQSAMAAADAVLNADYSELAQSPKFQQTFLSIDADPQHAQLTDRQKMDLAKERVADEVRAQLATDPQLLAVNAMAAKLGDAQLLNLAMRGTANTVKSGMIRNATEQGAINAAQGGYSRYQENMALRDTAGMDVSPWEGVADATIEGAALGAAMGAPFGAVAGYRGRRQAADEAAMREAEVVQQDDAAPQPESVDPVAQHRESMQGMNREQLLEQYADADMATEGDASATHRREAASQLLNELDEQAKRQAVMNELKAKPRSELLEEYRRLSQKEGRTETEEQQFQAIREVIRPQQEVTPEAQSQSENAEDGNGSIYPTVRFRDPNEVRIEINGNGASRPAERIEKVRPDNRYFTDEKSAMGSDVFRNAAATGLKPSVVKKGENQYAVEMDNPAFSENVATETINTLADGERIADADPMEQPAFMRDPRFRGFTGDDTEVQARLARGNAPTAEELVRSQMAEGDAGPTAQELTERPRLPAPGDIHPGQGYPLPGEVARTPDENQAGRGGRFTTTGEVKGQSFQKGRGPAQENAAGRQGEILEGETVRRGLPSPDEQSVTAPVREGLPAPDITHNVRMPQPEQLPRTVRNSLPELAQQAEVRRQTGEVRDIPHAETTAHESETVAATDGEGAARGGVAGGKKIEDFGEEIKGAAKHRYAQLAETLGKTLEDRDYATQPLSKLFPKPDYAKLANEGADADTLAMIALYRSDIPAKTKHNTAGWGESVKKVRHSVSEMLNGTVSAKRLAEWMEGRMPSRYADTWQLLRTLPPSQMDRASAYRVVSGVYQAAGGKRYDPPQKLYSLRNKDNKGSVIQAIKNSDMPRRSALLDEVRSKPYWSTDVEMAARAFERYVQDKARMAGVENDYLVNIRKAPEHNTDNTWAYPTNAELDGGIREAFDHLFRTLKTRETDKGVAFYSRKGVTRTPEGNLISDVNRSAEAKGSPVPQVEAVARGVMSGIKDSDLKVRVVKSQKEAEALAAESFDGYGRVHAFYRPDKREIVLVADNIPDGRTVREKLRHEIIHHAMEHVVTPAEYQTIIKTVLKTRDSDNATIREAWRKVDASYGKESPEVQAGEFLAHMAEKQPNKFVAAWERVVALVKGVLRRTGLLKPTELNDIRLVRETIRTLGQRVREGYTPREDGAGASSQYSRSGKPDPFKVPEGEGERYRDDLARMMKSLRTTDLTVNIGRTPPVLRHLGAPDLPLVISRDTVRKATNGVKHVVPMDVIERLPELMHDPDAIYRSATERNAVVMLLDAVDKNGDPVVSAVHMKATQKLLEVNRIASVYGTENGKKLKSMEMAGLTLYRREKLNPDGSLYRGLQLPKDEHSRQGSADKILYPEDIRKGPYYSRTSSLTPEETIASRFVRQMQDKFQVLKAVQENIRKTGGKIDDSNNAYMAEELFHGKAENDLNVMKERYVQPLAKLLADYKIAQADLDEYLYARHAPERNAHIAKINPKMPDGGSGMSNAEAAEIMQRVRNSGKQAQYDRLAGIIDDMLARRREIIREAGLEESGVVDAWQKAYRYYVPLKGQDVDGVVSLPRTGKGFTIGGRESKQAMGRASRAQSPSTQAIQDLSESLIRNRKNEVGNAFLKLVQDNPDKDYWQVFTDDRPDTMRVIAERKDQETGETIREVVERPVAMAMMADRYFTTKKNGKTYYIKLHDPRLMRAMKNMGPETSNAVIRTLGKVNRFLATVNTSYNPEFLVSNFIRDVQTAVMNLKAEQGRSDGKLKGLDNLSALAVVKDSRSAMSAVYASLRGKNLTGKGAQWQKVWKEFVEDGGKTGWFNMGDLEGQQKEMDRLVSLAKGGWKGQSIGAWNSFLNLVEDANGAVENALRLSAYKHARDAGLSRQQAASLAKNMTVNFNRRGEQGALMNSLYMFANASIQGTANLVRTLGHLNGEGPLLERLRWKNLNVPQKIALAAVGAGYLLGSLNRSVAGEDDDGVNWYDKVPSHVKERNLVIMKSVFGGKAGEYWSIPLPYGYNVFFLLGHTAEGVAAGDLTASRAAGNVVGGVLGAFSPVGSETSETLSGALLKNAAPTILRPFANLAMNENFMGAQIYQENMPFGTPKPDSQLGRRSTPEAYKAFASWLNAFSGGSQYRPGAVDITPESLKFWIDYISGGTGRFISKTTDAAVKSLNGIDIPEQQVPFLGKISGEVMPYADQQKMYDRMTEIAQYHAELKSLTGAERTAFIDENNGKLSMNGLMQDTRKRLKDLRKQRDAIYADSSLSLAQQAAIVKSVERDMKVAVDRFNREYNKKVGVD